jgi:hypothetical protein
MVAGNLLKADMTVATQFLKRCNGLIQMGLRQYSWPAMMRLKRNFND